MTALLETVPGIASVLRSPTADALVGLMKAAAGIGEFRIEDTQELIQYAVRRGLIGADEGDRLTVDIQEAGRRRPKAAVKVAARAHRVVHKAPKGPSAKKTKAGKKRRA
jgi:hypothetical protein